MRWLQAEELRRRIISLHPLNASSPLSGNNVNKSLLSVCVALWLRILDSEEVVQNRDSLDDKINILGVQGDGAEQATPSGRRDSEGILRAHPSTAQPVTEDPPLSC